ncbi:BBE domain-containing protein [Sinomonas sp. P47F7]|uniref:BBE domain-containing protein n=1 Tax=Sinomonas sp. P47F7 TaxID=3410987 RepID=UPI003BF4BA8A
MHRVARTRRRSRTATSRSPRPLRANGRTPRRTRRTSRGPQLLERAARVLGARRLPQLQDADDQSRIEATLGSNYARLAEVKGKYDPDNFFHVNQNIKPA